MQATIKQIHVNVGGDSQETYFLRVDWKSEMFDPSRCSFRMLLTDGLGAWRGKVSEAVVRAEAEELEMEKERYIQDLQQALTSADTSSSSPYSFTLTAQRDDSLHSGRMTLYYEKVEKGMSLRLGSVSLRADPYPVDAVKDLLLLSVERERTLNTHNQELQEHNHRLNAEQQRITAELQQYVDLKASLETELYSRFLLVLNEKKKKIRHLQETIKQLEEARTEAAAVQSSPQKQQKEDDEYGGSTEDEEQPGPHTSSSTSTTSQGARSHSPLMSLSDNTDVAPSRKRRIHHVRAAEPPEAKRPSAVTETGRGHSRRGSSQVVSSTAAAATNQQQRAPPQLPDTVPLAASPSPAPCADDLFDEF